MLISGVWHGAAWTFIIWGALHGIGSVLTRELERSAFYRDKVPAVVKQLWVYLLVNLAWIFFNAKNLSTAWLILTRIFGGAFTDPRFPLVFLAMIVPVWAYQFLFESRLRKVMESGIVNAVLVILMLIVLLFFNATGGVQFIYVAF
jgi:alginate O-acetyltransferase complex protein AlgI